MNKEYLKGWNDAMSDLHYFGKEIVYAIAKDMDYPTNYNRGYCGYLKYGKNEEYIHKL